MPSSPVWTRTIRHGLAAAAATIGLLTVSAASFAQAPPPATPGCQKDTDCKGNRVCQGGQCVEEGGAANSGGPPPGAPGAKGSYYDYKVQVAQDPRLINDWQEGDPIPEGYIKTTRLRTKLIGGGAGLLGGLWVASIITGAVVYEAEKSPAWWATTCDVTISSTNVSAANCDTEPHHRHWGLFVPVVGPFIDIGTTKDRNAPGVVFDILDGLGQAGGLAMIIIGATQTKTVLVRAAGVEMTPMPIAGNGQAGLGLVGTF